MGLSTDLAEAVKDALAAGVFSVAFTPVRLYIPTFTSADLATLRVTVAPSEMERSILTRASRQVDRAVDVKIAQRVQATEIETVDGLVTLVDELAAYLDGRNLGGCQWLRTVVTPWDEEALHGANLFAALVTTTYRTAET